MKKLLPMLAVGLSLMSSATFAQCSSCAGSAPSFQAMPYSGQVYGGYIGQPVTYGMPISYSSAPVYTQPTYSQPIYSEPAYTQPIYSQPVIQQPIDQGCCGQIAPMNTPMSFGTPIYDGSMGCGDCGGFSGGMVVGDGGVIYGDATMGSPIAADASVEGAVVQPEAAVIPAEPTAPAAGEAVTPPAPEGGQPAPSSQPAPEEKKDGET